MSLNLRDCNYVNALTSVRELAHLAGIKNIISVRELIALLGPRLFGSVPFYILGHNTNSLSDIHEALDRGANAIEVDVSAYEFDLNQLCVAHAGLSGDNPGNADAPRFGDFLDSIKQIAQDQPQLALVVFDCKPPAATPELGPSILNTIRQRLTNETRVNVIISVADVTSSNSYRLDGTSVFDPINQDIGPREGFMIDEIDDPVSVISFFEGKQVERACYGNGSSFFEEGEKNTGFL